MFARINVDIKKKAVETRILPAFLNRVVDLKDNKKTTIKNLTFTETYDRNNSWLLL